MNPKALMVLSLVVLAAFAGPSQAAGLATPDGLVPVHSRYLDELYLRPDAALAGYRRVMIDPVRVAFHRDWLKYKYASEVTRPIGEDGMKRIAETTAADARAGLAEAFRARGYEIVTASGPGVLRLSPSVADLYVNAPDRLSSFRMKAFTREAGEAVLLLDARDSVSGALLGRVVHRGTAQQMGRLTRASDVSNRFWFEALLRRWAVHSAAEFQAGSIRP